MSLSKLQPKWEAPQELQQQKINKLMQIVEIYSERAKERLFKYQLKELLLKKYLEKICRRKK